MQLLSRRNRLDVRYWPLADIASCVAHVRFRGQSGHWTTVQLVQKIPWFRLELPINFGL
jgi:hypothetical protein